MSNLLEPSLTAYSPKAIYSSRALFIVAFVGGAFSVVLMAGLNSIKAQRIRRDWPWIVLGFVVALLLLMGALLYFSANHSEVASNFRLANRGIGCLLFLGYQCLYRAEYRSIETLGVEPLNPWIAGIACVVLAYLLTFMTVMLYGLLGALIL